MSFGWREQILDINLTSGDISVCPLPRPLLQATIGGVGLAARLIYDNVPAAAHPLGPDNVLAIVAGPIGGTNWAGSGRIVLAARSPLTGVWGEASLGGYFGTHLKRQGYDAILLRGISPHPVMLVIDAAGARLETADHLWGEETYTTEIRLKEQFGKVETIAIGPAGERLVMLASLVHHMGNNVAARCGLGAVAGSKRLKAIVVGESKTAVPVADPDTFRQLMQESMVLFKKHDFLSIIRHGGGTAAATPISIEMNDMPVHNWALGASDWEENALAITGPAMQAQWPAKKDTCYACPIACKWTADAPPLAGDATGRGHLSGPEYESLAGLGAVTENCDPLAIIQASDLCNRMGIDTISTGAAIGWALEAAEKGLLPAVVVDDDLTLRWGDPQLVLELARRIGENRPGLGALLAQGTRRAALAVNSGLDFAIQVKGLELPFHHPRALRGLEVAYATLPRGATHNEEGVVWDINEKSYESWIKTIIANMDLSGANSSMVYCQFLAGALDADYTARLLTAVTGLPYSPEDLTRCGERTWYLRRAFNLRLGVGLEADELPKRIIRQLKESASPLTDFAATLTEFHRQRQLDKRGIPSAPKLAEIGLEKEWQAAGN